jgi:predicted nucleic acid-binding protein
MFILTLLRTLRIAIDIDRARLARDEAYRLAIVAALHAAAARREG